MATGAVAAGVDEVARHISILDVLVEVSSFSSVRHGERMEQQKSEGRAVL
jgi:hypothetical protein